MQWLARQSSLYVLLVLALTFASLGLPLMLRALEGGGLRSEMMSPSQIVEELKRRRENAIVDFEDKRATVATYSASVVKARLSRAQSELADVTARRDEKEGWFASIRPRAILERKELEFQAAGLRGEIRLLEAARAKHQIHADLQSILVPTEGAVTTARTACIAANNAVRTFNSRNIVDKSFRNIFGEADQLTKRAKADCDEYRKRTDLRNGGLERARRLQARLSQAQRDYANVGADAKGALSQIRIDPVSRTLQDILVKAAILLAGIFATPFLIRLVFYLILAPLAERRPAIRISQADSSRTAPSILAQASATSAAIKLEGGEELLVRQGYLQSTSSAGRKSTQALLDWRHPLSSLASGLVFLTRINAEGETTTVSAVHDPFSEVAVLHLPPGAACVLQSRALAGVVQRAGQPIRITSHWRLGSLHAWLTLQLRYLLFHGPARLVIKGARGVRVERVEHGRVFRQDQLVGFSADLAYSVTRAETFWPYFLGLEQLLQDKVEAGEGVLILEEAPMAGRDHAHPRRGLEGAADVALKAVGL